MDRRLKRGAVLVALALAWGPALAQVAELAPPIEAREYQGVRYVTGGVGEGERERLLAQARDFNLKLLFAEKSRSYLSDVDVVVTGKDGRTMLQVTSDGPLLLAKLPPGEYRVSATAAGQQQTRNVTVGDQGQASLNFYW